MRGSAAHPAFMCAASMRLSLVERGPSRQTRIAEACWTTLRLEEVHLDGSPGGPVEDAPHNPDEAERARARLQGRRWCGSPSRAEPDQGHPWPHHQGPDHRADLPPLSADPERTVPGRCSGSRACEVVQISVQGEVAVDHGEDPAQPPVPHAVLDVGQHVLRQNRAEPGVVLTWGYFASIRIPVVSRPTTLTTSRPTYQLCALDRGPSSPARTSLGR